MVIDALDNFHYYSKLHKNFKLVLEFLKKENLKKYNDGKYDIYRNDIYLLVSKTEGKEKNKVFLEAHRKYIDIQMCLSGTDLIGYKPLSECRKLIVPYDFKKDCEFFKDKIDCWFNLPGSLFAIFFPNDAHAPLAGGGLISKAVIKVRCEI